ncbi:MAG: hypothetical protein ACI9YO_003211 [Gammaproteobacteria bacterium]|jgi:uncharacterized protein YjiS (DUF1127 family)
MTTFSKKSTPAIGQNFDDMQHGLFQSLQQWFRVQQLKIEVSNERAQLSLLSDDRLRDLGITRASAGAEALKSDLPAERLQDIKNRQC